MPPRAKQNHSEGSVMLEPDFSKSQTGLLPAIVQDAESKEVLMLAYMDRQAWELTQSTRRAHFFSRSRNKIWQKGESSGHLQLVQALRLDCDQDTILLLVEQLGGAACHKGYQSCFFQELDPDQEQVRVCSAKIFDPQEVYK
ncbi:MAG: phosphoribosyl-AMP cyclohydrolase [Desulfohalobiaceae bacterium]